MTPDKIKKNPDLWDIANDADEIGVELERIQYMLLILNENLEDEIRFLDKSDDGYAKHFVSRYDIHRAQLEMIEMWLHKVRKDYPKLPDAIRQHIKTTEVPA